MRKLVGAALLALALSAQGQEAGLSVTAQDLSRRDGVWPSATFQAESGLIVNEVFCQEVDPRNPLNSGARWYFANHLQVSPRTKVTITFPVPAGQFIIAYGTILDRSEYGFTRVFDGSSDRITLTMTNSTNAPTTVEYHWRTAPLEQILPGY